MPSGLLSSVLLNLSRVGINAFFACLLATVALAYFFPEFGVSGSLSAIATYGVSLIFFFYGLKLSPEKLKEGLGNWKLHSVVQLSTFLLFPCVALVVSLFVDTSTLLWLGFFYLAVLPSTVSSSVVMVSIAGGNVPAAIFNASISSIIGIVVTPLWMNLYGYQGTGSVPLSDVMLKLSLQVFLPLMVGMALHKRLGAWAGMYTKQLRWGDQLVILLIIYTSFCESFHQNMFESFTASEILSLAGAMLLFFLVVAAAMYAVTFFLRFSREDRIAVVFCGSKKSLVQGAVMGRVLFTDTSLLGIVLLPLMLYHALQLMTGSMLAHVWKEKI